MAFFEEAVIEKEVVGFYGVRTPDGRLAKNL